ncbi:MAG: hypothetical protein KC502_03715 [Myxococcales bacterium]|nr:hypothetical protein [Myxococcales bacterium]
MTPTPGDQQSSVLDVARLLRQRGEAGRAAQLLDATLGQAPLQTPATTPLAAEVAWLHLERADLHQDGGHLTAADEDGLRAVDLFQRANDRGGQAAAALLLGDLAWQGGNPEAAAGWWSRCHALADSVGNPMLGARALAGLALLELSMARPERAEAMLAAAEHRAQADVAVALQGDILGADAQLQRRVADESEVVEATVALVRARQAIRAGNWAEARLLLAAAAEVAKRLSASSLYVDALRLDAVVARRQGDPRSASEALDLAANAARTAGLDRLAALVDSERVLALADNEQWAEAFALQNDAPAAALADQPAIRASRLEAFAVLSLKASNPVAAERAASDAEAIRVAAKDKAGAARAAALLADAQLASGDLAGAQATAERAATAAGESGRIDVEVAAHLTQLAALGRLAAPAEKRVALGRQILGHADAAGSVPQRIAARDLLAAALGASGDTAAAQQVAEDAVDLADSHPLMRWRGRARARLAATLLGAGSPKQALEQAEKAASAGGEADDRVTRARSLLVGGQALVALGRLDEAQLALGHAMAEASSVRLPSLAAEAAYAQGDAFLRLRRARQARHVFAQAVDQARRAGSIAMQLSALRGAAAAARLGGEMETAMAELASAAKLHSGLEADRCTVDLARLHCERNAPDQALEALSSVDASEWPAAAAGELWTVRGQALAMQRQLEPAAQALSTAVTLLRTGNDRSLGAALFLLGQVEGMRGNGHACGEALGEALMITARLGLPEQHDVRRVIERIQSQAETER